MHTKGEIRNRKSKRVKKYNGQKKKDKKTNNDLQNTTHKTEDRTIRTSLKTGGELRRTGRVSTSCPISDMRRATLVNLTRIEKAKSYLFIDV